MPPASSPHEAPVLANPFHCSQCREQLMEYIRRVETGFASDHKELDVKVRALEIYVGGEEKKTGLFGAVHRSFEEIQSVSKKLDVISTSLAARENQVVGATWAAKALWAFMGAGGFGVAFALWQLVQTTAGKH